MGCYPDLFNHLFGKMGIEYIIVNLDKRELLDFDRLGFGTKIGATTSGLIPSFLSWLLVNPEGYGNDVPKMLGRWAGDRIEIVGDEGSAGERQAQARREFRDITIDAIQGYSEGSPFERITELQPAGLIDQLGRVITDPKEREAVANYWKQVEKREEEETRQYLDKWARIEEILQRGDAPQVRALRCPMSGGPLRIEYIEVEGGTPRFRVRGTTSDVVEWLPAPASEPAWVEVLGRDFETEPGPAEPAASPNGGPAMRPDNTGASGGPPSVSYMIRRLTGERGG
jgi:hypothetical protein